jgi:hypothetical protein
VVDGVDTTAVAALASSGSGTPGPGQATIMRPRLRHRDTRDSHSHRRRHRGGHQARLTPASRRPFQALAAPSWATSTSSRAIESTRRN